LHHFFLALFTQTTHATNQHPFIDQKQTIPQEEPKKTAISPHFLKFKKFHFSIMLICATCAQGIYAIGIYALGIYALGIYALGIYAIGILSTAIPTGKFTVIMKKNAI
jgi:hypothetical protein